MKEIWKDISGYEGLYQVSNMGRVKSLNYYNKTGKERVLKLSKSGCGYLYVSLNKKNYSVHRLVALAFVPNDDPEHKTQCNHINEIKTDCRACNLEWCSQKYNCSYNNVRKRCRLQSVIQKRKDGTIVKIWRSTADAQDNGYNRGQIALCCMGKRNSHKGYLWEFEN